MNVKLLRFSVIIAFASSYGLADAQQVSFTQDSSSTNAFRATLTASGLAPNKPYIWSINGYAGHKSNAALIAECEEYEPTKEGYCDNTVTADGNGSFSVQIQETFPPGRYKVKMLLKDPGTNDSVIWHQDPVTFNIQ